MYAEQGLGQLRMFLGHLRVGDQTGKLILTAMSYLQLIVGSTRLFLNLPFPAYAKWMEKSWLASLWQFLYINKLTVLVQKHYTPSPPREGDVMLTDLFLYFEYKPRELELLNQCRLYHQLLSVSDIANADGQSIDPIYKTRIQHPDRSSRFVWPSQGCPSPKAWKLWKRFLFHLEDEEYLRHPLGPWTSASNQIWHWRMSPATRRIYHYRQVGGWDQHDPIDIQGRTRNVTTKYSKTPSTHILEIPGDTVIVSYTSIPGQNAFFGGTSTNVILPPILPITKAPYTLVAHGEFIDIIEAAHQFFRRLLGPLQIPEEVTLQAIGFHMQDNSLLLCSDGSYSPIEGTATQSWIFSDTDGFVLWSGAGPIDGHPEWLSSYRPEMGGMVALLFLVLSVTKHQEIYSGQATLYCDNQGALDNLFDEFPKRGIFPMLQRDYDLLHIGKRLLREIPITVTGKWVKGHFTGKDRKPQHDLNALADQLANEFRANPPAGYAPLRRPRQDPFAEATLFYDASVVTSYIPTIVYQQLFGQRLRDTIIKEARLSQIDFDNISWVAHGAVFKAMSRYKRITTVKLLHRLWNVGTQKIRFDPEADGKCPCCRDTLETFDHVFQCQDAKTRQNRDLLLGKLGTYLAQIGTPTSITQCILAGATWWTTDAKSLPTNPIASIRPDTWKVTIAFSSQTSIGWDQLFRGRISSKWEDAFRYLQKPTDPKDLSSRWARRLIRRLFDISLEFWSFRNGVLHGTTVEEAKVLSRERIHVRVTEAYTQYKSNNSIIANTSRYLFRTSLENRLRSDDQYLTCWLQSFALAISHHNDSMQKSKEQARRFFGAYIDAAEDADQDYDPEASSTYSSDSWLSSPIDSPIHCHQARNTSGITQDPISLEQLFSVPPEDDSDDTSQSNASPNPPSYRNLAPDPPSSVSSISTIMSHHDTSSRSFSSSSTSDSEDSIDPDDNSEGQMAHNPATPSPRPTEHPSEVFAMHAFLQRHQGTIMSPAIYNALHTATALSTPSSTDSMPVLLDRPPLGAPQGSNDGYRATIALRLALEEWSTSAPPSEILQFDLQSEHTAPDSTLQSDIDENPYDSPASDPGQFLSDEEHTYSSGTYDSEADAMQIRDLIRSALLWLYSARHHPERYSLSQPIINAIVYLPVYYSDTVARAEADEDIEEVERLAPVDFALVPTVDDNILPSILPANIPRQIRFLLLLNDYFPNIRAIYSERQFEPPRTRFSQARHFPPAIVYMPDEIPISEQEDPPDTGFDFF